ncbi:MAG: type II toxin-antitoxin system prevent-host-death family antitoxin [Synergistaceae bacterium]|nr:type II toxin-antitoxin system prevent-host-death family antitoxin [Synergistaceae bacterium]
MEQININEARANLSHLVTRAANGEPFIITRFGKPVAMVSSYASDVKPVRRVGFLKGKIKVPDDFDTMAQAEIKQIFEGAE